MLKCWQGINMGCHRHLPPCQKCMFCKLMKILKTNLGGWGGGVALSGLYNTSVDNVESICQGFTI